MSPIIENQDDSRTVIEHRRYLPSHLEPAVLDGKYVGPAASAAAIAAAVAPKADTTALVTHTSNVANPHVVTKAQVGLANADNTADTAKPVSTAQATALGLKLNTSDAATSYAAKSVETRTFHVSSYANISALFTARNAYNGPAVIELASGGNYSAANLRIDKADTTLVGNSALITLPAGADQDAIRIHPDAMRVRIQNLNLAGNYANQTGTSRGIVFEPYTDVPFRYADRAAVTDCNIDGFLHDGVVIDLKRLHVVLQRTFVRDFGRYGVDINSSDCRVLDSAIGGIRGTVGIRVNAGSNFVKDMGVYSCSTAGILLTDKAVGCKIEGNDLDNNFGNGLRAIGTSATSLFTSIIGNHFRANSAGSIGVNSDIYLDQVTDIILGHNMAFQQPGSTDRTKYIVEAGTGVASLFEFGNVFQSTYPTVSRWNAAATTARITRHASLTLASDGTSDVALTRSGNGVQISNDFTVVSTMLAAVMSLTGTGGSGFLQLIEQTSDAAAPSADRARVFSKDNGSGKTQLCVRFATGAVQVIATEP